MTLRLTALSALDSSHREAVTASLRVAHPEVITLTYDRLVAGRLERRVGWDRGRQPGEVLEVSADCESCAIQDDLVRVVSDLLTLDRGDAVLIGLPPGVSTSTVLEVVPTLEAEGSDVELASLMHTVAPATLHDRLWSGQTLAEAGLPSTDDEETCGEFLVGELLLADCYTMVAGDRPCPTGIALAHHLAPQARAAMIGPGAAPGRIPSPRLDLSRFDPVEARWRTSPGAVAVPLVARQGDISSYLARHERPLHPARLGTALHQVAAGCAWSRGWLWVASVPDRRIAWHGVGPRISFVDAGSWLTDTPRGERALTDTLSALAWRPGFGDRGTTLAFTGDEVDPEELDATLDWCALTDAELDLGPPGWGNLDDPLELAASFPDHAHHPLRDGPRP